MKRQQAVKPVKHHRDLFVTPGHIGNLCLKPSMNGQEAFRRLANQFRARGGGSPLPGGSKGFFAGSGLLIALVGGGLAVNASLFNGAFNSSTLLHDVY